MRRVSALEPNEQGVTGRKRRHEGAFNGYEGVLPVREEGSGYDAERDTPPQYLCFPLSLFLKESYLSERRETGMTQRQSVTPPQYRPSGPKELRMRS
jgi:hypothetical protein